MNRSKSLGVALGFGAARWWRVGAGRFRPRDRFPASDGVAVHKVATQAHTCSVTSSVPFLTHSKAYTARPVDRTRTG